MAEVKAQVIQAEMNPVRAQRGKIVHDRQRIRCFDQRHKADAARDRLLNLRKLSGFAEHRNHDRVGATRDHILNLRTAARMGRINAHQQMPFGHVLAHAIDVSRCRL